MLTRILRLVTHGLLFLAAVFVFFLGLGIGLQFSPQLGTALWVVAGLLAALNLVWIFRRKPMPSR